MNEDKKEIAKLLMVLGTGFIIGSVTIAFGIITSNETLWKLGLVTPIVIAPAYFFYVGIKTLKSCR